MYKNPHNRIIPVTGEGEQDKPRGLEEEMQPATACAVSASGLTVPWLSRFSSWRGVQCAPRQRVYCAPNTATNSDNTPKPIEPEPEPETEPEPEPEPEPLLYPFKLKPLPYPFDALEPHMSKETVQYHWERHQKGHVESLNNLVKGTEYAKMNLQSVVNSSYNMGNYLPFFIDASQVWNHEFFWETMRPGIGKKPSGILKYLILRDFGSLDALSKEIQNAALTQFGSGWVWLAFKVHRLGVGNDRNPRPSAKDARLVVVKTPNAVSPLVWDYHPLLAIDVWEHAYYMDYENRRGDYVSVFLNNLVSWEVVRFRLKRAIISAQIRETIEKRKAMVKKFKEMTPDVNRVPRKPVKKMKRHRRAA